MKKGGKKSSGSRGPVLRSSPYGDTAFASNKGLPLHRWVNWIAGFSAGFVQQALELHLPVPSPEQVVLDPFGGVGTTPITAYLRGHSVLSYEINPFPALVQRAKLDAISHRKKDALKRHIEAFSWCGIPGSDRASWVPGSGVMGRKNKSFMRLW